MPRKLLDGSRPEVVCAAAAAFAACGSPGNAGGPQAEEEEGRGGSPILDLISHLPQKVVF